MNNESIQYKPPHKEAVPYDQNGPTNATDWDWEEIDRRLGWQEERPSEEDLSRACLAMQRILEWVWSGGPQQRNRRQAFTIRSMIVCWILLKRVRDNCNETQLASLAGCTRANVSKHVKFFKRQFPGVVTVHMRNKEPHRRD